MNIEKINETKHICISTNSNSFAYASTIYTYILTLHKKVSIVSSDVVVEKFAFLPWFDKVRRVVPSSAELIIESDFKTQELYDFFVINKIKINKKMATALYTTLLLENKNFQNIDDNGIVFAQAKELIELGAEHRKCHEYLYNRTGLNILRLKSILFKNFILKRSATEVEVTICDDELQVVGARISDVYPLLEEFFTLVNVNEVTLIKSDEENKILINLKEK
jgi:phosphoesterase RecJ-like protein